MENIYNNIEIDNSENNKKIAIKPVGSSWQETRELSQQSASGEKVILNNVDSDKFIDIYADGNYNQETTEGYNIFDEEKYRDETLYTKVTNYFLFAELPNVFKTEFYANVFLKGQNQKNLVIGFSLNKTDITYRVYDKRYLQK